MLKRNLMILAALVILITAASYAHSLSAPAVKNDRETFDRDLSPQVHLIENTPLPQGPWPLFGGDLFDPEVLHGRYLIINFWASWCPPCIVEFPDLVSFARDNPEFTLVFISNDFETAPMEKFFAGLDPDIQEAFFNRKNIISLHDANGIIMRDLFQTYRLPETYIVDDRLRLKAKIIGVVSPSAFDYIKGLPEAAAPSARP